MDSISQEVVVVMVTVAVAVAVPSSSVADGHPLKGAGERVHKGLVLVHLRARSVTQSCTPRINLRFTAAWASRREEFLYPQKSLPRSHEL